MSACLAENAGSIPVGPATPHMEDKRCARCGYQLHECPNCKQKLDKAKPVEYTPDSHVLSQVAKPPKRGKIRPMPKR